MEGNNVGFGIVIGMVFYMWDGILTMPLVKKKY